MKPDELAYLDQMMIDRPCVDYDIEPEDFNYYYIYYELDKDESV